jgi:parallel beta-helix repeat protein
LSIDEKLNILTVLYHILDYGDQWVYQYWLFYVFNDYHKGLKNKHYGDWEAVFVFVDKDSGKVLKTIGTAHQRRVFDTEINNPENNHIWTYVGGGSHANCVDKRPDGYCDFLKWRKLEDWDRNGYKIINNKYTLKEINANFINEFEGKTTLNMSSELGINVFDYLKVKKYSHKKFYIPLGGSPPTHAWAQSNYYNPEELRPISRGYLVEYVLEKSSQAKDRVVGFFDRAVSKTSGILKGFGIGGQPAGISGSLFTATDEILEQGQSSNLKTTEPSAPPQSLEITVNKRESPVYISEGGDSSGISFKTFPPAGQSKPEIIEPKPIYSKPKKGPPEEIKDAEKQMENEAGKQDFPSEPPEPPINPPSSTGGGSSSSGSSNNPSSGDSSVSVEESNSGESGASFLFSPSVISPHSGDVFGTLDDLSTTTDGFQVNLVGTSTPDYSITIFINSATTTPNYAVAVDDNGDWSQIITLEEGLNNIRIKAEDGTGNESEEVVLTLNKDTISPSAIVDLSADSGNSRGTISLSWTAPGDDESIGTSTEYIVRYATSSEVTADNWDSAADIFGEPTPSLASTTESFIMSGLEPGQTYYWAIKAKDEADNISGISNSASSTASALASSLVINEIQIDGLSAGGGIDDDWVEIYNPTDQDIDISNWSIQKQTSSGGLYKKNFEEDDVVPANGFFLIVGKWADEDIRNLADMTCAWLLTDGNTIYLVNNQEEIIDGDDSNIVDKVGFGDALSPEGSSAQNPPDGGSIERRINGWDTDNNSGDFIENKLPSPRNSQGQTATLIRKTVRITEDTVWTLERSPYVLKPDASEFPTVESGTVLTIEPGVVIKTASKYYPSLVIKGALKAQGTADQPITFTAATSTPQSGDWAGIVFDSSTSTESVLSYVNFEYGGYPAKYQLPSDLTAMVKVIDSQITITNSTFKNSQNAGVYLVNSDSDISNSNFENNEVGVWIRGAGSQPIIDNCQFSGNNTGIKIIDQSSPAIKNSTFNSNNEPVFFSNVFGAYPVFENNQASGNNLNGIVVDDEIIFGQDFTLKKDLPYIFRTNFGDYPTVASGTTLTLEPGVIIKTYSPPYTILVVEGNLVVQGSTSSPIVFTSLKDDSYGGDTNNDGDTSSPEAGDWKNIKFTAGSSGNLDHVLFRYGSSQILDIDSQASVIQGSAIDFYP